MSYEAELQFAKQLAREAGEIMRQYFGSDQLNTEFKPDNSPLTVADTIINQHVIEAVQGAYPEDGILGEEASFAIDRERLWVVDPIDGTMPFSIGIPVFTFSLALVNKHDGQPVVGVTYDPFLDQMYSAVKGGGAFLGDQQLRATDQKTINKAVIAASSRPLEYEGVRYNAGAFSDAVRLLDGRTLGFASFVYTSNRIATGQIAGSVVGGCGAWDVAASSLIVQEAGGVVTDLRGEPRRFDEDGVGCVQAANPTLHAKIMELLQK